MTVAYGKSRKNSLVIETISLKKPTALDKLIEKVEKPRGAVPNFGLPKWKHIPLESKIPLIQTPKGAFDMTRKKLGEKLWAQPKGAEFDLNDPYNREIEFNYDPLHDEHLARYYSQKRNTRHLLKLGLVNEHLDAICTLKDYNVYRKYLKKLHNDRIEKELKRQQNFHQERRALEFAETAAKREFNRLKKEERKTLAREKARKELELAREEKMREQRDAAERLGMRLKLVKSLEEEERQNRVRKLKARTERAGRKRAAISEIQRDRGIKNLADWARKESHLRKARRERSARRAEERRRAIEEMWERRKEQEEREMARERSALRYVEKKRQHFIKSYTSKIQRARAKFQKRVRNYRRLLSCSLGRKRAANWECCRRSESRNKVKNNGKAEKRRDARPMSATEIQIRDK